jgi:hypothetical protein
MVTKLLQMSWVQITSELPSYVYYLPVIVRKYNRKLNSSAAVLIIIPLREFGNKTHEETNGLQPSH